MSLDVERLEMNLRGLAGRAAELAELFYERLFQREPALRDLFGDDLVEQKRKLIGALTAIVGSLREPQRLREYLHWLGGVHRGYGVRPEHYPVVGETLLIALRDRTGPALWDAALERAWSDAYAAVQALMLEGAARSSALQQG